MNNREKPKICIPLVERTKEEILETALHYTTLSADMVEWRVDFYEKIDDLENTVALAKEIKEIVKGKGKKELLITFRTEVEGGELVSDKIENPANYYANFLKRMIAEKVCDYIDIELKRFELTGLLPREEFRELLETAKRSGMKVIGSYHNFAETPSQYDIVTILGRMEFMGFSIGKVAVMPQKPEDVEELLLATEEMTRLSPDFPLITMSMGELGRDSRLYGHLYGSSVTFACAGKASAPGQVDIETVKKALAFGDKGRRHIILIGFMGTGKSTVSGLLKKLSGREEIDTDRYIEEMQGKKIKDIFAEEGEEAFRQMETDMINELEKMEDGIVSCGGGMALRSINVKKLKQVGRIILLTAKPETVYERVKESTARPILNGNMNVEFIRELMEKRRPFYERAADFIIETDRLKPEKIAKAILKL